MSLRLFATETYTKLQYPLEQTMKFGHAFPLNMVGFKNANIRSYSSVLYSRVQLQPDGVRTSFPSFQREKPQHCVCFFDPPNVDMTQIQQSLTLVNSQQNLNISRREVVYDRFKERELTDWLEAT
eukprot:gb/GEZJ01006362.1/.p1 GENE.gb/GEZJ01006362.1/~~gb/GEZJ01006362.1/.p1  ORF type:complete len:125 (-),score=11.22 gb/GEZJ01006362.1/:11-385(-)